MPVHFQTIYGVDFSGAKLAGRTIWVARAERRGGKLQLLHLSSLEKLCGVAEREAALACLVDMILASNRALWAVDCPFGLPFELMDKGMSWPKLLGFVRRWDRGAYDFGLHCLRRAKELGGANHLPRVTDAASKAPFSCYHYRIIYQTFHGIRDLAAPLANEAATAVLPFQYRKLAGAKRVLVETCPSSTLKRLKLPYQNYKQPAGGRLTLRRRRTRHVILKGLEAHITISTGDRRRIMRNGGGDALDAVIAAVGVMEAWRSTNHARVSRDRRACREGMIYA